MAVPFPITGDTLPGAAPSTAFKTAVSVSTNAVLGANDFATITVREDDGTTGTTPPIPPVGPQGDRPGTGDGGGRWACGNKPNLTLRAGEITTSDLAG